MWLSSYSPSWRKAKAGTERGYGGLVACSPLVLILPRSHLSGLDSPIMHWAFSIINQAKCPTDSGHRSVRVLDAIPQFPSSQQFVSH